MSKVSIENMPDESETKKSLQEAGVTEWCYFGGLRQTKPGVVSGSVYRWRLS